MKQNNKLHHNHLMKLSVNDLDRWVQFYIVDMGFDLLNVKKSSVLLSNGHILLKLQKDDAETN